MPTFLTLPDWVPPWAQIVLTAAAVLLGLMWAAMPFSVWGVRGRLDLIEARLDELQGEIRSLALRLPEADDADGSPLRPPIPPAASRHPAALRREPRLD